MSNQQIARKKKDPLDFYETPPEAIHAICDRVAFSGLILEPAAGNGAIVEVLRGYHYQIMCSDIVQYGFPLDAVGDFLTWPDYVTVDWVVTNPPYNQAEAFVRKALEITTKGVAMLMRLAFLEGQKRYKMFVEEHLNPTDVYVFSNRITCDPDGVAQVCFAWFIWDKSVMTESHDEPHDTIIHWIMSK